MDSETPVLKWTAAAVGVILVCFCIGYFVLGPNGSPTPAPGGGMSVTPVATSTLAQPSAHAVPVGGGLLVDERTDEIAAKQKAQEEAKKKLADAEATKKADSEAKAHAEEAAAAAAAVVNAPAATPTPDVAPVAGGAPSAAPTPADAVTVPPVAAPVEPSAPHPDTVYRVRVGSFASRDAAKGLATELNGRGYTAVIVADSSGGKVGYRLQVGAYRDKKSAEGIQQELKANGYDSTVSE